MIFKRLEDIIVSTVILLLISPVLLIISVAVKFSSPGPVLFRQLRYGMDGKPIRVWKFRSMRVMENDENVVQATKMIFVLLRSVNFYAALLSMNYLSSLTFGVGKCQLLGPDHMLLPIMNNTVH